MHERIYLIWLLPLIGAVWNLFLGRIVWKLLFNKELPRAWVHTVAIASVGGALAAVIMVLFVGDGSLWDQFKAYQDGGGAEPVLQTTIFSWLQLPLGDGKTATIDFLFRIDTLTAVMLLVVTFVGLLIHIYSTGYMAHEPRFAAFFGYLNLFTSAMLILVMAGNMPVMFIGWEGVGLCSYLLIGFWFEDNHNAYCGRKAFIVNRVGDFAFILGMILLFYLVGSADFSTLETASALDFASFDAIVNTPAELALQAAGENPIAVLEGQYQEPFFSGERLATFAGILLFIGACGKSAQIPLYVWLPDAMAGPTPVSALIHAATMVTAGVYMIARLSFLYVNSTTAMAIVAGVGALTALWAALMAFAQTDLKKVLAYSTVSQLGFMFAAVGVGAHNAGIFHLVTHAFFKAGLFLAAGSVMHAMSNSGDINKMGGLRKKIPWTHACFLIYCLAIAGLPPLSGFFSKDEILGMLWTTPPQDGWLPWFPELLFGVLSFAAVCTAFYMFRLYFLVFSGKCRADEETKKHIHESPASMTGPLVVLALGTVFLGIIGLPHLHWFGGAEGMLGTWLDPSLHDPFTREIGYDVVTKTIDPSMLGADWTHLVSSASSAESAKLVASMQDFSNPTLTPGLTLGLMGLATLLAGIGIFAAYRLYKDGPSAFVARATASGRGAWVHKVVYNKFYVDEFYDKVIIGPFRWLARATWEFVDKFIIDGVAVRGSALVVDTFGRIARFFQNGQVQRGVAGLVVGGAVVFYFASRPSADFEVEDASDQVVMAVGKTAEVTERAKKALVDYEGAPVAQRAALERILAEEGVKPYHVKIRAESVRGPGVKMRDVDCARKLGLKPGEYDKVQDREKCLYVRWFIDGKHISLFDNKQSFEYDFGRADSYEVALEVKNGVFGRTERFQRTIVIPEVADTVAASKQVKQLDLKQARGSEGK